MYSANLTPQINLMGDCGTDALPRDAGQQPVSPPASQEVSVLVTGYGVCRKSLPWCKERRRSKPVFVWQRGIEHGKGRSPAD